jgi:hypothetical protein
MMKVIELFAIQPFMFKFSAKLHPTKIPTVPFLMLL